MAGADELNEKQKRFCKEYVTDFNATRAAIRAGYAKASAHSQASDLLKKPKVQAFIAKITKRVEEKLELSAERVLYELKCLGYAKLSDYYEKNSRGKMVLKDLFDLTDAQQRAIRSMDVKNGQLKSITLYNKDPSLDKLGRNLKLFTELNETVHSFNMMPAVKATEKKKGKAATVTVRELTFDIGEAPSAR